MISEFRRHAARGLRLLGRKAMETGDSAFPGTGWGRAQFLPGSGLDWANEAGNLWDNSVLRSALKWQEDAFGEPLLVVRRPGKEKPEIVPGHPAAALLENPNEMYDGSVLLSGIILSLRIDGNAYLYTHLSAAGAIVGLEYVPHFLIDPRPGESDPWIQYYQYGGRNVVEHIPPDRILHLRDGSDPLNPRRGLSRTGAVLRAAATVNNSDTFSAAVLRNMGVPGLMIAPKEAMGKPLTKDQRDDLKRQAKNAYTGDNALEPMVHSIPIDVTTLGFSPEQMALDKVLRIPIALLCSSMNLDPRVLGLPSASDGGLAGGSKDDVLSKQAYNQCVIPGLRLIDRQLTRQLQRRLVVGMLPGDVIGRDYSAVASLQENQDELHKRAREDYAAGVVKRKRALAMIGEEYDDKADDVYYTDLVAAKMKAAGAAEPGAAPAEAQKAILARWRDAGRGGDR